MCVCVCVCSCSTLVISLTWTLKEKRVLNILFLSWCVHVISCYGFSARIEHKWWRHCSEWKFISIGSYWRDHTETGTSPPKEQVSFAGFCIWFFLQILAIQSVCCSWLWALPKQLNWSRCHLKADFYGSKEPCIRLGYIRFYSHCSCFFIILLYIGLSADFCL